MELRRDYWQPFPYADLAAVYDVVLPMVYSTYRGDGRAVVTRDVTRSMTILRTATGRPDVPIHLIGGLGDEFSGAEARAFARLVATLRPHRLEPLRLLGDGAVGVGGAPALGR